MSIWTLKLDICDIWYIEELPGEILVIEYMGRRKIYPSFNHHPNLLYRALYMLCMTSTEFQTGDIFQYKGRTVFMYEGVHLYCVLENWNLLSKE